MAGKLSPYDCKVSPYYCKVSPYITDCRTAGLETTNPKILFTSRVSEPSASVDSARVRVVTCDESVELGSGTFAPTHLALSYLNPTLDPYKTIPTPML